MKNHYFTIAIILSLFAAGFFGWLNLSQKDTSPVVVLPQENNSQEEPTIGEEIKTAFSEKYGMSVSETIITIESVVNDHVEGRVSNNGTEKTFSAVNTDKGWELFFDGNGGYFSCDLLARYNFPEEMKTGCVSWPVIEIKPGETFSIELNGNPTTGYNWQVTIASAKVELSKREYRASNPELMGSSGVETFQFKALEAGRTTIKFTYSRPWESVTPLEEKTYEIIVD